MDKFICKDATRANVTRIYKDGNTNVDNIMKRLIQGYNVSALLQIFVNFSFAIDPQEVGHKPTNDSMTALERILSECPPRQIRAFFRFAGAVLHPKYETKLTKKRSQTELTPAQKCLQECLRTEGESIPAKALKMKLDRLSAISGETLARRVGMITQQEARNFVLIAAGRSGRQGICISTANFAVLALTGYQHDMSRLRADCEKTIAINEDFLRLRNIVATREKQKPIFSDYHKLLERSGLDDIRNTKDMTARQIVDLIASADIAKVATNAYLTITVFLTAIAEVHTNSRITEAVLQLLPARCLYRKNFDTLCKDPWTKVLAETALEYECRASTRRTHDIARLRGGLQKSITRFLRFLASHAREQYASRTPQPENALKEFFETAEIEAWRIAIIAFGSEIVPAPKSKLVNCTHQASKGLTNILRLCNGGFKEFIKCQTVGLIKLKELVNRIPSLTVPGDPSKRRTLNEEEYEKMLSKCTTIFERILMVILHEVAPRTFALDHTTVEMFFDAKGNVRDEIFVPEKAKTYRGMQSSELMKSVFKEYFHEVYKKTHVGLESYAKAFLFNLSAHDVPVRKGHIYNIIKRLARAAEIKDVTVYPHMFRHTIIVRIVEMGNSIDDASKFIGHKGVAVTDGRYNVATVQQVYNRIKNVSFLPGYKPKVDVTPEEEHAALQYERDSNDALRRILLKTFEAIGDGIERGTSLAETQRRIFSSLPDLEATLGELFRGSNTSDAEDSSDDDSLSPEQGNQPQNENDCEEEDSDESNEDDEEEEDVEDVDEDVGDDSSEDEARRVTLKRKRS